MGSFNLIIPELGNKFVDYRQGIAGDSFNWSWVRPMSQVRYLVIHHTAGPDTQTPDDIAAYHINHNGWGGIGYHFVITKDGTVYYVGDLTTARAHVANMNELALGICIVGDFTGVVPNDNQIGSAHLLCAHLLFATPELPGTDGWEDVVGHKQLGATACPGDTWDSWKSKLIAGIGVTADDSQRLADITQLYRVVLGREPDQTGIQYWNKSGQSIDQIRKGMTESDEHIQIINKAKAFKQAQTLGAESLTLISSAYAKVNEIMKL